MTEYVDGRIPKDVTELIDTFIADNGEDSVTIYNGVDIEKIRLFTGRNGKSVKFFDFVSSEGNNKITQII